MLVQLVRATTPDGCSLDGALHRPDSATPKTIDLDACVLIHGTGGNFYSSTFFELLAAGLTRHGVAALRANTRGHEGISTLVTSKGAARCGAAYEIVDDCRHDLAGWVAWLKKHVGPRVALLGHSLGAVKALYATTQVADLGVPAIVAISPPRLSYSWFCQSPKAAEFLDTFHHAEGLVHEGKPATLLEIQLPLPLVITAAGYVEKYGPDERYNYLKSLPAVTCPTLVLFGGIEIENNMAFQCTPEEVSWLAQRKAHIALEVVAGADHFYTGVRELAWQRIETWLLSRFAPRSTQGARP